MIRPFQIGDLLLVQRLGRQATSLNVIQALLQPRTALRTAVAATAPWAGAGAATYVLRQQGNGLARAGFIQVKKRPGRPESDIILLSPALDTPWGHPAIWKKLLAHYIQDASHKQIARIYADVPDQPLPVSTFSDVGFRTYTRQTIWRLTTDPSTPIPDSGSALPASLMIRPQLAADEWELARLYTQVTPKPVQRAEGAELHRRPEEQSLKPFFLDWWHSGSFNNYVMLEEGRIVGCILIGRSHRGNWLRLIANTQQSKTDHIHHLLRYGLAVVQQHADQPPVYIGVRDYHGGMNSILADYGFAPFTDRARMVKQMVVWVKEPILLQQPLLETVVEAVPTSFTMPEARQNAAHEWIVSEEALHDGTG